jgi:hypothetical protein
MASLLDYIRDGFAQVDLSTRAPDPAIEERKRALVEKGKKTIDTVVRTTDALFPGLGQIAHGITTGDWQPYKAGMAQKNKEFSEPLVTIDPKTGEKKVNREAADRLGNMVFGFINPAFNAGKVTNELGLFAKNAAKLDKADDIANAAKQTFKGITDDEARALGTRYEKATNPTQIEDDLRAMADQATRKPSAQGALDETGYRRTPPKSGETPSRPESEPYLPAVDPAKKPVATSDPVYRTLFEDTSDVGITLRKALLRTVEYAQDTAIRARKLQQIPGTIVDDASNIYQAQTLYPGRVQAITDEGRDVAQKVFDDLSHLSKVNKVPAATLRADLNDYLISRHAPERNVALGEGAAGMTTAEATAKQQRIASSPVAPEIERLANELQTLNNKTLDMLRGAGVIRDELHKTLRERYKFHVPLYRVMDSTEDLAGALSGKGFDVRSTGIKTAKGSKREVSDIVSNILYNHEQAAIRSEKNIVDKTVLDFVRKNKQFSNIFEEVKPSAVGTDFQGKPILENTQDPQILQLFEDGKRVWVKIKDPHLAVTLRGIGREKLGPTLSAIGAFTRFYSGLMTRFNPEFFAPNKIRDLQESMVYIASQKGMGAKGALGVVARDPQSIRDVTAALRGKDTPGTRLYKEMRAEGGTTGGMGLSTKKQVELDVEAMARDSVSAPRRAARNAIDAVDNLNTIFEDSTRLSVYRTALGRGLSKKQAAALAKEASINFNRMGQGGPVVNALWMFSNASIQGSTKMIRSMKNPKVAAGVLTTVVGSVLAVSEYNDKIDPEWRDKITKWDRMNALPIMIPTSDGTVRYITIPVSWGLKPIKVFGDYVADSFSGKQKDVGTFATDLFTSIAEGYNPVGGTDPVQALTPTIIDVPVEIARNRAWSGSKIRSDYDQNAPPSTQYFDSLREKASGRFFADATQKLARMGLEISPADVNYAYEQYIGGTGRAITKTANTLWGIASPTADAPPMSEFPLVSRFYKQRNPDEVAGTSKRDEIKALEGEASRERFYRNQEAGDIMKELERMPDNAARKARLKEIARTDPKLAQAVLDDISAKAAGLTGDEKKLKSSTVETRAQFIVGEIEDLSKEERTALLKEYAQKKILTSAVLERLKELLAEQ